MEIVQKRMENMTTEIEQMRRTKLFSDDECKKIVKTRKEFENKICGFSKNLQNFRDYIEYEKGLLRTIKFRRSAMKVGEKKGDIEHKIMNRIKELYETTLQRFPDDTILSLAYFKFCKQANYVNAASVAVSTMIKNHSHNVEMWQVAAKWHAYDRRDISTALKILCKGLAKHKTSKLLYTEVILLEVRNAGGGTQGKSDKVLTDKQQLCLEKLHAYIKEITTYIQECEYYVDLLDILGEHTFTAPIQSLIIEHLITNYSSKALTWNILAQRDWKGLVNPMDNEPPARSTKMKLTKCIERYQEGLRKITDPSEKEELWPFYINCILNAKQDDQGVANLFKTNCLKTAFEQASVEGFLPEKYYIQWLDLVDNHEKPAIIQKGTERYSQSIELWKHYLRMEILAGNKENIEKVFRDGVKKLGEKALPLWTGVIRYHLLSSSDDTIEAIYQDGIKEPQEVSDILKPQYIEWLAVVRGMKYTRKQYFMLASEKPYCKELHVTMSKLESTEIEYNFEEWDKIHELACEQFGKEDVEVWLNRIQYYIDYKQGTISKEAIQQVHKDAKQALPTVLFLHFEDKYYAMTNK